MDNKQLATVNGNGVDVLANVELDPRILMAAKAIQIMNGTNDDGTPKISTDMAIAAALYQAGTGQLVGRDFYVNDKVGRMEGYRGAARDAANRGAGELQIDYRPLHQNENEEHEVKPGDTAYICEVYQLRAWRMAQRIGQPYKPIIGVGIIREIEKYTAESTIKWAKNEKNGKWYKAGYKPREQWVALQLEGGMTWAKKAKNRAYKDALRHVPGAPISAAEILEEAALDGVPMPPEGARLTPEQAEAWVEQQGRTEATVAEFRSLTPEEQSARFASNVAAMRGAASDDPLGVDTPPAVAPADADPFVDAPPPPGAEWDNLTTATEERQQAQPQAEPVPNCHKCGGPMWDNRESKQNPNAPDFKCKDKACGGAIWIATDEAKGRGALAKWVKQVYGESDHPDYRKWLQDNFRTSTATELTPYQLGLAVAIMRHAAEQQQPA